VNNKTISFIQQFKKGDQNAFDRLVLLHKDWVIGMIYNLVHNKQDAEDISQDVFVSVYFALDKFKHSSTFKTWLYRIVINKVSDHYRKLKLKNIFSFDLSEIDDVKIAYKDDEEEIFKEYDKKRLQKAIISLSGKQRNVLLLRVYQNHSFKEISEYLGITVNNAKVMYHQANKSLKKKIK
jgi:RNA polymerase sigma-70 factor (ECF subfamily)